MNTRWLNPIYLIGRCFLMLLYGFDRAIEDHADWADEKRLKRSLHNWKNRKQN